MTPKVSRFLVYSILERSPSTSRQRIGRTPFLFDEHVKTMRQADNARIAEQFERQASESRALADKLEEAE